MSNEQQPSMDELRFMFDRERHARERWWREDELVNQRTTWLLTTQAVLGTAYGFVRYRIAEITHWDFAKGPIDYVAGPYLETLGLFAYYLVCIGITGSSVSFVGILAAHQAQRSLRRQFPEFSLGVTPFVTLVGHMTALATPFLFIVAWSVAMYLFKSSAADAPTAGQAHTQEGRLEGRPAIQAPEQQPCASPGARPAPECLSAIDP